jgi:hypothetical protein
VLSGGKTVLSSGEPPLIEATGEPTKVQPQSPGGVEIPNQNKQIFERAGYETQTKVVNREEQPVDIRQAARAGMEAAGTTSASTSPVDSQPANLGLNLGEPRRVRTISIRPDGTVLGAEASTPQPAAPVAASVPVPVTPLTAQPVAAAGSAETGTRQVATTPAASALRAATPSPAQASGGGSPQAVPTTPAAPALRAATLPPAQASGTGSPQAVLAAASPPAPQRVASVAPIPIAPAPAPSAEAVQAGGFAVQLGFSQSEGEARALFQRLQQKFADLASIAPMIRQAEVNGNTIYRVRVGPMGRDDASSLCAKLQGQGGQCFVAKN